MKTAYNRVFYDGQRDGSAKSAKQIVPLIMDLVQPCTVVDIGCGVGTWCSAFLDAGAESVTGIDGPWVANADFELGPDNFVTFDFGTAPTPFDVPVPRKKYDLAITLEFIEHIAPARADALVDMLTSLADTVIAGGAIPGQGGTHHVNEQWPAYWEAKFRQRGFEPYDFLRPLIWDLPDVMPWYSQNTIAYFRSGVPKRVVERAEAAAISRLRRASALVHPRMLELALDPWSHTPRTHLSNLVTRLRPYSKS